MIDRLSHFALLSACGIVLLYCGSAAARDFVVDSGACPKDAGDGEVIYCTIQAAIDAAFLDGSTDVVVMPGVYRESILLREEINVQGEGDGVIIEYPGAAGGTFVTAADESGLGNLTLRVPAGAAPNVTMILISGVEDVELEDIIIDGGMNRNTVGVYVRNQMAETSRMRNSELRQLEVGVLAEDTFFRITRCLFEDILRDGIFVRPPTVKGEVEEDFDAPDVGDEDDLELSGFNRFRNIGGFDDGLGNIINEGDSFYIRNTTSEPLFAQLNDWGIYDAVEIATRMSSAEPGAKSRTKGIDPVVFEPYHGKSIFPGSIFTRIRDTVSTLPLTNANPRLRLLASDTGIDPAFDAVSKLYSFTFINPDTYTVLAQAPAHLPTTRVALVAPAEIVALDISLTPDGTTEGEPVPEPSTTDQNANGLVDLSELLRVVQLYNIDRYHCQDGTEDGYSVGAGSQLCAPHSADYAPQDWKISLTETLRNVQFFNTGGYHPCPGSEDGFCPGPEPV
jgi:hypothetical protein